MLNFKCLVLIIFFLLFCQSGVYAQVTCITSACHEDLQEEFLVHPEEFVCTACHTGNFDEHDKPEVRLGFFAEMCTECHNSVLEYAKLHQPVAEGDCQSCHNPHASLDNCMLRDEYSSQFYVDYTRDKYSLCFSCHKPELLMYPETTFATGFRHGTQNLHYLHVNKEKRGRNCSVCHGAHGAAKLKLMNDRVRFGNWQVKINFQITENGGSCAPGCHRPKMYDRKEH